MNRILCRTRVMPRWVPVFLLIVASMPAALPAASEQGMSDGSVEVRPDLSYAGNANPRQTLDLYLPRNRRSGARLPVIVYFHGGGWYRGSKDAGGAFLKPYVESGAYAGVSAAYRLSGEACWPAQIHDAKAVIRWIRAHAGEYGLEPEKIGVMGSSAGGTLATLLGTSGDVRELEGSVGPHRGESSRVTCVVNRFGRINFLAEPASARSSAAGAEALAGRMKALFDGAVEEKAELARQASPLTHLSAGDPPILTLHGTRDGTVPIAQAEELDAAAKRIGATHFFVRLVGAGHGFNYPEEQQRAREFFDHYLRGIPTRVSTDAIVVRP